MDVLDISRWQFGITTVYHFLFVPITIGLAFLVARHGRLSQRHPDGEHRPEEHREGTAPQGPGHEGCPRSRCGLTFRRLTLAGTHVVHVTEGSAG